jgi:hypothetical protein
MTTEEAYGTRDRELSWEGHATLDRGEYTGFAGHQFPGTLMRCSQLIFRFGGMRGSLREAFHGSDR